MKITNSYITLDEMVFFSRHGVLPQERITGNNYRVNLRIKTDFTPAVLKDDLSGTINYAELYKIVKEEMDIPSQLIEYVAGRIVQAIFWKYPRIEAIDIRVSKINPPLGGDLHAASVELHCSRYGSCEE